MPNLVLESLKQRFYDKEINIQNYLQGCIPLIDAEYKSLDLVNKQYTLIGNILNSALSSENRNFLKSIILYNQDDENNLDEERLLLAISLQTVLTNFIEIEKYKEDPLETEMDSRFVMKFANFRQHDLLQQQIQFLQLFALLQFRFAKYPTSNFSKMAWHNFRTQIVRFEGDIKEVDLQNVIEELSKYNMIPLQNVSFEALVKYKEWESKKEKANSKSNLMLGGALATGLLSIPLFFVSPALCFAFAFAAFLLIVGGIAFRAIMSNL